MTVNRFQLLQEPETRTPEIRRRLLDRIASKPPLPDRQVFNAGEIAEMLGVTKNTVYRLFHRQLLKPLKVLRVKRIPRAEFERFLRENL